MALSKSRQADIMVSDMERRAKRELLENAQLGITNDNSRLTSYNVVPSNRMRDVKVTENCWNRGLRGRTFGVADPKRARETKGMMKVTRNGITTIVPVNQRTGRSRKTTTVVMKAQPETATMKIIGGHNFAD